MTETDSLYHSILEQIRSFWKFCPDKPEENPESILRSLWLTACGVPTSVRGAQNKALPPLEQEQLQKLYSFIEKKRAGVPSAYICERAHFLDIEFLTGPQALIPRIETEILGNAVLEKLRLLQNNRSHLQIIDVCTGCGNLALSYAHYFPNSKVFCSDVSDEAIKLAKKNGDHLHLQNVEYFAGDLFSPFRNVNFLQKCDVVSCNPPYISTSKVAKMDNEISGHEPKLAFDGGTFGISILSRVITEGPEFLKPGSWLCFETGLGQGPALVTKLKKNNHFKNIEYFCDGNNNIRAICAQTSG
ncbi:MAG TPA: peptide chain release factor N(5)-glutamine methyltransferase [Chitinispirillaceae bacterium]|nr:peptide chain release factor N(5)-glutamine methyltransferase [Chitinispirillaceae bacterium]